jgi:hypothetical protein
MLHSSRDPAGCERAMVIWQYWRLPSTGHELPRWHVYNKS